jgi:hypothetical protein
MAKRNLGEPHPSVPHLYRKPQPRDAATDIYPYLPSQSRVENLRAPSARPLAKGLIVDSKRGGVSPLGGVATVKGASK